MKKVLALVLAVMMMATVAFAEVVVTPGYNDVSSSTKDKVPGSKIEVNDSGLAPSFTGSLLKAINSTDRKSVV